MYKLKRAYCLHTFELNLHIFFAFLASSSHFRRFLCLFSSLFFLLLLSLVSYAFPCKYDVLLLDSSVITKSYQFPFTRYLHTPNKRFFLRKLDHQCVAAAECREQHAIQNSILCIILAMDLQNEIQIPMKWNTQRVRICIYIDKSFEWTNI